MRSTKKNAIRAIWAVARQSLSVTCCGGGYRRRGGVAGDSTHGKQCDFAAAPTPASLSTASRRCPKAIVGLLAVWALLCPAPAHAQRLGLWPSDAGTALPLTRHDVQVTVNHPVAEILVTQEFQNSSRFDLEATFYYPVPAGATVAGMALLVNGVRREARMLERQKAREIYDGIVAKKRDPALLERVDGTTFKIRIFPVLAKSRTRVELRFVQPVERRADGRYSVTLRKPPGATIHVLRLGLTLAAPFPLSRVQVAGYPDLLKPGAGGLVMARPASVRSFSRDIRLSYRSGAVSPSPAAAVTDLEGERLVVAEIPPAARGKGARRKVAILVDSSRTMARHLPGAGRLVDGLLRGLARSDQAAVVPFGLLPSAPVKLRQVGPELGAMAGKARSLKGRGGTAFVPAFEAALAAGARHIICITDGGSRYHQAELEALLRRVVDNPGVTISLITPDNPNNADSLRDLTQATGGILHAIPADAAQAALVRSLLKVSGRPSARLTSRGEAYILSAGTGASSFLLALRVPAGKERVVVELTGDTERKVSVDLSTAGGQGKGPGVLYASAAIDDLMRRIKVVGEEPALRQAVVKLSKDHNVLSEYTALLATETDAQFNNPTSGRKWQRKTPGFGDDLPSNSYSSTPEPHEVLLVGLALLALWTARRRGWIGVGGPGAA